MSLSFEAPFVQKTTYQTAGNNLNSDLLNKFMEQEFGNSKSGSSSWSYSQSSSGSGAGQSGSSANANSGSSSGGYGGYGFKPSGLELNAGIGGLGVKGGIKYPSYSGGGLKSPSRAVTCVGRPKSPVNGKLMCTQLACEAECYENYQFPNGATELQISCAYGEWSIIGSEWDEAPDCEPICLPSCQNNGICIAPNECKCPNNFEGAHCQHQKNLCLNDPPYPANSQRSYTKELATVRCLSGYLFPDGTDLLRIDCVDGEWVPARKGLTIVPDCIPVCEPKCQNGGVCSSRNFCTCPDDFRGPQCQYSKYL